jgi:hypothetical protein
MQSFKDPKWQAFVKKCKKRVADDNKELGITSIFLPQPKICPKPKVLLIAMEPGMKTKEETEKNIKEGNVGFVHFTIDYCAYKYLCGGKFQYQLVDFCKGAMTAKDAATKRLTRYKNWLPLLKEEWELLGKPPIIAIGKGIYNTINKISKEKLGFKLKIHNYIIHYSGVANKYRQKEYDHFKLNSHLPNENAKAEMRKTIEKLLKANGINAREEKWEKIIKRDIKRSQLLAIYKHNFEDFKIRGKIHHAD